MQRCLFTRMHSHTHIVYMIIYADTTVLHSNWGVSHIIVVILFINLVYFVFFWKCLCHDQERQCYLCSTSAFSLTSLLSCVYYYLQYLHRHCRPTMTSFSSIFVWFKVLFPIQRKKQLAGRDLSWLSQVVVWMLSLRLGIWAQLYAKHPNLFSLANSSHPSSSFFHTF